MFVHKKKSKKFRTFAEPDKNIKALAFCNVELSPDVNYHVMMIDE